MTMRGRMLARYLPYRIHLLAYITLNKVPMVSSGAGANALLMYTYYKIGVKSPCNKYVHILTRLTKGSMSLYFNSLRKKLITR